MTVGYVLGSPGKAVVTIPLTGYPVGTSSFHLRVLDPAGNWSNAVATDVTVSPTVGPVLFADGFDSGTFANWSSQTGTASVVAAAGLFPSGGTNKGMSVTLPATAYVTDDHPVAEPAYHAKFAFSGAAMRVPSGNGTVITLFDARTASGSAYAVQVGRSGVGAGAPNRVRVVMQRTAGGALTGPWVALGTGAHRLQTDWVAGTTTALGSLRLLVDGTTVSTLTGNASSLRVESVRLGLVAGAGTGAGTAAFDAFTSSRTSVG